MLKHLPFFYQILKILMTEYQKLIDELTKNHILKSDELLQLIECNDAEALDYLFSKSRQCRELSYGKDIYIRGLIEISNCCKNDCYYCGIRRSNTNVQRYHLTTEQIRECCRLGYELGFRTFVLQGGEDLYYDDDKLCLLISEIKKEFSDCALTLSLGEKSRESYQRYYDAGADRYLLRHETANEVHYGRLHPDEMSAKNRKQCLYDLKEIGYQVGSGFMVGSPYQTSKLIVEDLLFLKDLQPAMVGIGPFIPHHETPFAAETGGTLEQTLTLIALIRLLLPHALIPATTALGTIATDGRSRGILAGANVIMPNLSPEDVRQKYMIYDNKLSSGAEAAESLNQLKEEMRKIGYQVVVSRGDVYKMKEES